MVYRIIAIFLGLFLIACNAKEANSDAQSSEQTAASNVEETKPESDEREISTITFPSLDGLEITADLYQGSNNGEVMVLCHQAKYCRAAYTETALNLMKKGYNCLAIDQRSGDLMNGKKNETALRAKAKGLPVDYLDAEQDMIAAVNFAAEKYGKPIILVGSSYSASLALKIAKENENVKAVLAFSPGEYFKGKLNVAEVITGLDKPTFVTGAKREAPRMAPLTKGVVADKLTIFEPGMSGSHGAKALWPTQSISRRYWEAVDAFLATLGPES